MSAIKRPAADSTGSSASVTASTPNHNQNPEARVSSCCQSAELHSRTRTLLLIADEGLGGVAGVPSIRLQPVPDVPPVRPELCSGRPTSQTSARSREARDVGAGKTIQQAAGGASVQGKQVRRCGNSVTVNRATLSRLRFQV